MYESIIDVIKGNSTAFEPKSGGSTQFDSYLLDTGDLGFYSCMPLKNLGLNLLNNPNLIDPCHIDPFGLPPIDKTLNKLGDGNLCTNHVPLGDGTIYSSIITHPHESEQNGLHLDFDEFVTGSDGRSKTRKTDHILLNDLK